MQGNTDVNKTQPSGSDLQLEKRGNQETSQNLSKDLAMRLYELLIKVTKDDVSPSTVNAACNCASEIHKILKLNYDMKRNGL